MFTENEVARLRGTKYMEGFCVQEDFATAILAESGNREKIRATTAYYGIVHGDYSDYLALVNKEDVIEELVPLNQVSTWRKDMAGAVISDKPEFETAKSSGNTYFKWLGFIVCALLLVGFMVILLFYS